MMLSLRGLDWPNRREGERAHGWGEVERGLVLFLFLLLLFFFSFAVANGLKATDEHEAAKGEGGTDVV